MGGKSKPVWILAEQREGKIHPVSYELLGKGREIADAIGSELCAVLLTEGGSPARELIYRGADKVYLFEDRCFASPREIVYKKNIVELVKNEKPEIFLIGATKFGRSLAPRIAAALETGLTADCTGLGIDDEGDFIQIRPAFTGNVLAHINTSSSPKMSTVRYREFAGADRDQGREGEIIEIDPVSVETDEVEITEVLGEEEVNLEDARIIVSGGRGLNDRSDFELLEELAGLLDGKVGSSRPLVDDGWIDKAHQVGYSGKRVKPTLYIACGISGASQHLAGMKDSDIIMAINTDPSAPIFEVADYEIVGDLYEVVPKLIERLKGRGHDS